jgi:hypothetical protein
MNLLGIELLEWTLSNHRSLFILVDYIAPAWGDLLLRELEHQCLWLGGMSVVYRSLCKYL